MATKNNPGDYDCYERLEPDEPGFTLMARDAVAPETIRHWVDLRRDMPGQDQEQLAEALDCADQMELWRAEHRPPRAR